MNKISFKRYALLGLFIPALALNACGKSPLADPTATPIAEPAPATSSTQSSTVITESAERPIYDADGNVPGAIVGKIQRSWPDVNGSSVDSQHRLSGQYSTDEFGRPVWTPIDHEGDLPRESDMNNTFDDSKCGPLPDIDSHTEIQYLYARYLAVSDHYGPTHLEDGVPRGYAHHPNGAVLAAINQLSYGLFAQGDEVGYNVDRILWGTSKSVAEIRAEQGLDKHPPSPNSRARTIPAATGARIISCSKDAVTVKVGILPGENESPIIMQIPFVWQDGDWQPDLSTISDEEMVQSRNTSYEGFSEIYYAGPGEQTILHLSPSTSS